MGEKLRSKIMDKNSMLITAISRSLKISNSEGAVVKAKEGHFPLLGNLHCTRCFSIILNINILKNVKIFDFGQSLDVLGELLYSEIPAVRPLNSRFSMIP